MGSDALDPEMRKLDDLLARLQRAMLHRATLDEHRLTASQVFILRFLDKCNQAKASDIARVAGLSPGAVTQVCDELVRLGYIERTRSTEDRRVVYIFLTEAGKIQLEQIRQSRVARMQNFVRQLGEKDANEFVRLLGRVVELVEQDYEVKG